MEQMQEPVRRCKKHGSRSKRGPTVVGELTHQQIHTESGQRERSKDSDVIGENEILCRDIERPNDGRDAEEVLGVSERVRPR